MAMLPAFLLGGLAALVRVDVPFDEFGLGKAVSAFFATSAVGSIAGGRIAERVGARRGLILGLLVSAGALLAIGVLVQSFWQLAACMGVAGVANGILQPSANLSLARAVAAGRQGISFGVKQSAVLTATLLAGVAVPAVGLTLGWRWAFTGAAMAALCLIPMLPREPATVLTRRRSAAITSTPRLRALLLVALSGGLGSAAANSMGAFYVESAVHHGQSLAFGGLLLSFGSICGIAARLASGWAADRFPRDQLRVVGWLLLGGAAGMVLLAASGHTAVLVLGTVIAFAAGWGWPGLQHLAVVQENMDAPAAASGIAQAGTFLGGVVGPAGFGWLASTGSFAAAWMGAGGVMATGAAVLLVTRPRRARAP